MRKVVISIILLLLLGSIFLSGCNEEQTGAKTDTDNDKLLDNEDTEENKINDYKAPNIIKVITADNVNTYGDYTEKDTFEIGDTLFVYYEYNKVNHDKIIDVYHTISVHHQESWVSYYSNNYADKNVDESDDWCRWWEIDTEDFPSGLYSVQIGLLDEISQKSTTETVYFTMVDSESGGNAQVGYSRKNPADIGTTLTYEEEDDWSYGDYKIKITLKDIIRGDYAWYMIEDANMFNDEPGTGKEYILAKIRFEYLESSEDAQYDVSDYDFTAVSEDGKDYDNPSIVQPEPELDADIYPGAYAEGWGVFEVDIDDDKPLLTFGRDWKGKGGIWFKLYS